MTVITLASSSPCPRTRLAPEQGAAVLLPGGGSAAVFLLHDGSVHAVGNLDPFYGAPVICHGIVGDRSGAPTVASPLGKQVFCLRTGRCLDDRHGVAARLRRAGSRRRDPAVNPR